MTTRLFLVVLSALLLAPLAPSASATTYGVCIEGQPPCYGDGLVCVVKGTSVLACVPDPCATANCWRADVPTVQCTEGLETYGVLAECSVDGATVGGPVGCRTCVVTRITLTCTEGTEGIGCSSDLLA